MPEQPIQYAVCRIEHEPYGFRPGAGGARHAIVSGPMQFQAGDRLELTFTANGVEVPFPPDARERLLKIEAELAEVMDGDDLDELDEALVDKAVSRMTHVLGYSEPGERELLMTLARSVLDMVEDGCPDGDWWMIMLARLKPIRPILDAEDAAAEAP